MEKYVLIQKIELTIGYDKKEVLKISDISKSILYDQANQVNQAIGEKEILTLIRSMLRFHMRYMRCETRVTPLRLRTFAKRRLIVNSKQLLRKTSLVIKISTCALSLRS